MSPDGARPAYLALRLAGTDLSDAAPLARCAHVQRMALPSNKLTSIAALGALGGLSLLDVSGNELTEALDLGSVYPAGAAAGSCCGARPAARHLVPPPAASSLVEADLSCNAISALRDLPGFTRLARLALDGNRIVRLGGALGALPALRELSLRGNLLANCGGLEGK